MPHWFFKSHQQKGRAVLPNRLWLVSSVGQNIKELWQGSKSIKKRVFPKLSGLFHKDSNHSPIQIAYYIIPTNLQATVQQATLQSPTKHQTVFGSKKTSARFLEVNCYTCVHLYIHMYHMYRYIGYPRKTIELSQASFCRKKSISLRQICMILNPYLGWKANSCPKRVITGS